MDDWRAEASAVWMSLAELSQKEQALQGEKQMLFARLANIMGNFSGKRKSEDTTKEGNSSDSGEKGAKKAKKEKYQGPKRPGGAYAFFSKNNFQRCKLLADAQGKKPFEIIGIEWTEIPDGEKKKFDDMAEADHERYARDLRAYHEKFPERATEKEKKYLATDPAERKEAARVAKEKKLSVKAENTFAEALVKEENEVPPTSSEKKPEGGDASAKKKKKKKKKSVESSSTV